MIFQIKGEEEDEEESDRPHKGRFKAALTASGLCPTTPASEHPDRAHQEYPFAGTMAGQWPLLQNPHRLEANHQGQNALENSRSHRSKDRCLREAAQGHAYRLAGRHARAQRRGP